MKTATQRPVPRRKAPQHYVLRHHATLRRDTQDFDARRCASQRKAANLATLAAIVVAFSVGLWLTDRVIVGMGECAQGKYFQCPEEFR